MKNVLILFPPPPPPLLQLLPLLLLIFFGGNRHVKLLKLMLTGNGHEDFEEQMTENNFSQGRFFDIYMHTISLTDKFDFLMECVAQQVMSPIDVWKLSSPLNKILFVHFNFVISFGLREFQKKKKKKITIQPKELTVQWFAPKPPSKKMEHSPMKKKE